MGVLDKIKNALFEVEYVEVEEPPKKEKKVKEKKIKEEKHEDKPIAKKIVLPGKREEKVEEIEEEELVDEDFEVRPVEEEKPREEFKFMDDNDFKVDDNEYLTESYEEKEVVEERPLYNEYKEEKVDNYSSKAYNNPTYSSGNLYGMNNTYDVPVHQYGTYEKVEKTYFKPSPIISPIYGVLDKNYKKEDVKEKKDIRLSSYSRSNVNVDDIRDKAYGKQPEVEDIDDVKFDAIEEDNVMVDLSDRTKPEVKELTVGDAEEYFEDLGLEYNVDYVDVSTDRKATTKKEEPKIEELESPKIEEEIPKMDEKPIDVTMEESNKDEDDDNLFDLIDSMYQE